MLRCANIKVLTYVVFLIHLRGGNKFRKTKLRELKEQSKRWAKEIELSDDFKRDLIMLHEEAKTLQPMKDSILQKLANVLVKSRQHKKRQMDRELEEDFEVEAIVGMVVADGKTVYANQGRVKVGTVLYRIVWKDYPPDVIWYEPAENLGDELLAEYEAALEAEAELDAEEAAELAAEGGNMDTH